MVFSVEHRSEASRFLYSLQRQNVLSPLTPGAHFINSISPSSSKVTRYGVLCDPKCFHFPKLSFLTSSGCFTFVISITKVELDSTAIGHVVHTCCLSNLGSNALRHILAEAFHMPWDAE